MYLQKWEISRQKWEISLQKWGNSQQKRIYARVLRF
jgi:hypothetical protein